MKKNNSGLKSYSIPLKMEALCNSLIFKRRISGSRLIAVFAILLTCLSVSGVQVKSKISANTDVHKWVVQHFAKGKIPPFSFVYGGISSDKFIKNWQYNTSNRVVL